MFIWKKDELSQTPFYKQLACYIESLIKSGALKSGDKLPSERLMAEIFNIGRNTVCAATDYLAENGYITKTERAGAVIASAGESSGIIPKWERLEGRGHQKVSKAGFIESGGFTKGVAHLTRRHVYGSLNFAEYLFDNLDMNSMNVRTITNEDSIDSRGLPEFRSAICRYSEKFGIKARPEEVMIFTSVTQFLNMFASVFLNPGVTYYHEKSSFIVLKDIMASSGANFRGLDMDKEGIIIDSLASRVRPPKNSFLHFHACGHNPTGITTSASRREEILKYCLNRGMPVIEMDSTRGLYYKNEEPNPLKALDRDGSVVYVGSFLRPSSEMLGLAWIIADEYLVNRLAKLKRSIDVHPNLFAQLFAYSAMNSGLLDNYLSLLRAHLASQTVSMFEAMRHYIGDVASWDEEGSCYYIWPEFEKDINTKKLYEKRTDIDFNPGFFYNHDDTSHISLTTLSMDKDKFPAAFAKLRSLIDAVYGTKGKK